VSIASPPPGRDAFCMSSVAGEVVLYGGSSGGDTWVFGGTSWTQVGTDIPPGRSSQAAATANGRVVMFGGLGMFGPLNDTWTFSGTSWTQVSVSQPPSTRTNHAMATLP
jgi:hypothetical protein